MKIVAKGIDWNDWLLLIECKKTNYSGCSARLEISTDDIEYRKGCRYDYSWECYRDANFYSVICPCCGKKIYIDEEKIPYQVKEIIQNKKGNK